jgi:integrase
LPRTEVVNHRDVPTREEVSMVISNPHVKTWVKAWIVAQCQSGLSLKELRTIQVRDILPLLDDPPIVMPMYRGKEHVQFHMVMGSNAAELLMEYINRYKPRDILFPYTDRTIQLAVKKAFSYADINKYVVPHSFRKFFSTTLKMVAKMGRIDGLTYELIEYWMGHKLNKTQIAYFVPPPPEQRRIYSEVEHSLSFF